MRLHLSLATLAGAVALAPVATLGAQDAASKLSLHGYLTQGAAVSDSLQTNGIGDNGTTNYRRAALLLRYAHSAKDAFVVQVAHRRLGDSPFMALEPDVKVDWAFYERRFLGASSLRVGKAPIPFGIYNETRYTGTLLPFYRAPYAFYFEGAYTSESIDGLVLSTSLFAESPLRVDASVYGGNYGLSEFTHLPNPATGAFVYTVGRSQAQNALGGQLWVHTPFEGLRVGGGGSRATMSGGVLRGSTRKETKQDWHAGVDGDFDRVDLRGEYRETAYRDVTYTGYYAQAGVRVFGGLSVNAQGEVGTAQLRNNAYGLNDPAVPLVRDNALGLSYAFRSDLVLKVEGHQTKDFNVEQGTNVYTVKPPEGRYVITSLSLSF